MQKIIAANWKMYKTRPEARQTAQELAKELSATPPHCLVVVFPSFTNIADVAQILHGIRNVSVGAQNCYPAEEGAFTGEVSPAMLQDAGACWMLVGHSERRHVLGESDELVARKTAFALAQSFRVMLCVGETLPQREAGELEAVLTRQLSTALNGLTREQLDRLAVAYEPVWAIGTGKVATPEQVSEAHGAAKGIIRKVTGEASIPVLYGGSVKPDNAGTLVRLDNVDGLLVGGASLVSRSFVQIIRA
ncbi:MAG: triose-phosphate isomerase [Desulfovibrio sp.]|jgi:triosephosphate isomerase|nr:triose-phosphate isomerase [Desulfovibrio sp.]